MQGMAVISERPRLAARSALAATLAMTMLAALWVAAGCSLIKSEQPSVSGQASAQHLAAEGKHADAARSYADLAAQNPGEHDNYELLSAEQWVLAGDIASA